MKHIFVATSVLSLALPLVAFAEDAPDYNSGQVTVGVEQRDWDSKSTTQATTSAGVAAPDVNSSKFLEYRDIPQGAVVPFFRFQGKKGNFRWDLAGRDVTQKDQSFFWRVEKKDIRLVGDYVEIPHNFGFGGRSILNPTTPNSWQVGDTVQRAWQTALEGTGSGRNIDYNCQPRVGYTPKPGCLSLLDLVTPTLNAQPPNVDLKLNRGRTNLGLDLTPGGGNLSVALAYFHEKRSGTRAANGTAFGFGNVVETPEPLRYVTQDFGVDASYRGSWGVARAAVHFNDFKNRYDFVFFENPFRINDSNDASAYQAPGTASINGAVVGQMALPPDNQAISETVGATFKFGAQTRLTADVTLGQWKQDHDPLAPWTTNTSITMPDGASAATAPLFAQTLGGKIDTMAINAFFHTTVANAVGLNARYRRYDLNNKTPRYALSEGYARFDAVWEEIPRANVPYGYTSDVFDTFATYGRGVVGVELGYRYNRMARTFRESDNTTENTFRGAVDLRTGWLVFRGIGELGKRGYDQYELARSEDASFLEAGLPANQTVLRRPDQAKRDLVRLGGQLEISPNDKMGLFMSYSHTKFKYDQDPVECLDVEEFAGQSQYCPGGEQAPLGMIDDKYDTVSVEANFRPTARVGLYAFYSYEDGDILQNGRQSGATVDFNPVNVWTANITNKGNTVGAGVDFTIVPDKWTANLFARYQKIAGNNDVSLQPGFATAIYGTNPALQSCTGSGTSACSIPAFDDTEITYIYGWLRYQLAKQWGVSLGAGWENYEIDDSQTDTQLNYMPASFFLQANNRGYEGWVGYLNLTYSFQ
jgi:hypothetical protein